MEINAMLCHLEEQQIGEMQGFLICSTIEFLMFWLIYGT